MAKFIKHIAKPGDKVGQSSAPETPKKKESAGEKVKMEGKAGVKKPKGDSKGGASKG